MALKGFKGFSIHYFVTASEGGYEGRKKNWKTPFLGFPTERERAEGERRVRVCVTKEEKKKFGKNPFYGPREIAEGKRRGTRGALVKWKYIWRDYF